MTYFVMEEISSLPESSVLLKGSVKDDGLQSLSNRFFPLLAFPISRAFSHSYASKFKPSPPLTAISSPAGYSLSLLM